MICFLEVSHLSLTVYLILGHFMGINVPFIGLTTDSQPLK